MTHFDFSEAYEAQRLANVGKDRWIFPWDPGGRFRDLYKELQLLLLAERQRITSIESAHRTDSDRHILTFVMRGLFPNTPPNPDHGHQPAKAKLRLLPPGDRLEAGREQAASGEQDQPGSALLGPAETGND